MGAERVRPSEWARVRDFATAAPNTPSALAIGGEAGAGKSTLWRAGVEAATAAEFRVLRSEPTGSENDMSFAGLTDLLADSFAVLAGDIPAPQREALEVALLLRPAGTEPPTERAVGQAVLSVLRGYAALGPTLIAIDDAHWLDEASVNALVFALRRLRAVSVSLLLSARTESAGDPLAMAAPPPTERWHDLLEAVPSAALLELAPLNAQQVQRLLAGRVTRKQATWVAEQSRGNPFWARELAEAREFTDATVPPLAATLTRRLSETLTPQVADALAVVAAAGRIDLADAVAALDHLPDPGDAVDAAVLARVVVESDGRLAVAHPLIGAAAVAAMPPRRRSALYRRLAAQSHNPERHAHFAALAAGSGPDPAVASALAAAAEAAHARGANAAAGQFALQAVQFTPTAAKKSLVPRRIRAGELLFLSGEIEQSRDQLAALNLDELSTPDLERALPLLLDMTELLEGTTEANAIVVHAVDTAGPELRRRALVLALASDVAYGIPGGRRAAAEKAIRCAEFADPPAIDALHRSLINLVVAKVTGAEGLDTDLLDRAAELEPYVTSLRLHDSADLHRGLWARYTEDLDMARQALGRCIDRARAVGDDYALWTFLCYLAGTEIAAADYPAAAAIMADADAASEWHSWKPTPWLVETRCDLLIAAGDLDAADSLVVELVADGERSPLAAQFVAASVRGRTNAWRGETETSIAYLERAGWCADRCDWVDPAVRSRIDPYLAHSYVAAGRASEASPISARLREIGQRLHRPTFVGDARRIDAVIAADAGDLDAAAKAADDAVGAYAESPLRLEYAASLFILSRIQRRRRARAEARAALDEAARLADAIGHRPLLTQIERELKRRPGTGRAGAELTATEQRVADLIATGATNRDAASSLFISVRTVETHVASIYRKLGVRNRTELARRLAG